MQSLPADGAMVAIFLPEDEVAAVTSRWPDDVAVAAVNGPATTVISGRRHAVAAVIAALELDPADHRRLDISVAAHSPLVEPILDEFEAAARAIDLRSPRLALISGATGAPIGADVPDAGYWRRHLRQPVRFAAVFDALHAAGVSTFLEVGPGSTLLRLGQRCWPDDSALWVPSAAAGSDELDVMRRGLATFARPRCGRRLAGGDAGCAGGRIELPAMRVAAPAVLDVGRAGGDQTAGAAVAGRRRRRRAPGGAGAGRPRRHAVRHRVAPPRPRRGGRDRHGDPRARPVRRGG